MYYKLYIDSVFVLLAAGNLCLLTLTGKILSCTATHGRILAGAAAGAAVSCMAAAVPAGTLGMRFLLFWSVWVCCASSFGYAADGSWHGQVWCWRPAAFSGEA